MKTMALLACAAAMSLMPATAQGAYIKLIDDGGMTGSAAEASLKIAAAYWGSILTNDVTITIGVEYREIGDKTLLGGASSSYMDYSVADWVSGVEAGQSDSTLDQAVVLPTLTDGGASFVTNGTNAAGTNDKNVLRSVTGETESSQTLYLQTAVVKAVGGTPKYRSSNTDKADAFLTLNSTKDWDFDPTNGTTEGTYDFLSVAIHEIGHALGFSSGVDTLDEGTSPGSEWGEGDQNDYSLYSALDMFRYSSDPSDVVAGDDPVIDLSVGTKSYFSIDGGETALAGNSFATGVYNGDGDEASHWRDEPGCDEIGTMSPTACKGDSDVVTALDLAAFDAIGWNVNVDVLENPDYAMTAAQIYRDFATAVPEPSSWAMMLAGFAVIAGGLRRGRSAPLRGLVAA